MKNPRAHSQRACPNGGFALVITLIMVALLVIITVGVFTSVSLERTTAKSYDDRYQAELAVQNGLAAAKQTLVASPNATNSATGTDTFLVVRADNGSAAYYYLAQPSTGTSPTITYYPLYSSSTDPNVPAIQTQTINLTAQNAPNPQNPAKPFAPLVPSPSAPTDSTASDPTSAWNAAKTQRLPTLYPWVQPTPSPSGPSVKWVEMRDPQDTATAPAHNLPYTRYAYWAEDLEGYLDASQVGDPNATNARVNGQSTWTDGNGTQHNIGTSPGEIAMFTIFAPAQQTISSASPTPAPVTNLVGSTEAETQNKRPLLFTVPTVQQIAATTPDLAGPNLAVRLGVDNNPGEQNLTPLGYGYGTGTDTDGNPIGEGKPKHNLNADFPLGHGRAAGKIPLATVLPAFRNRSTGNGTLDYVTNLTVDIVDYVDPQDAPSDFDPPGNLHNSSNSYRGIAACPFVVSLYDLNNWVFTHKVGTTYHAVVEVKTFVQLWNLHNVTVPVTLPDGTLAPGTLTVQYNNADQVSYNGNISTLTSPPDATINFVNGAPSDPNQPAITSTLSATGKIGKSFSYQITATVGNVAPMQPNSYIVVVLPLPTLSSFSATGLPPGLTVSNTGLISGKPTGGPGTFNVTISSTSSAGTTGSATLVITVNP